jgi:hypothetical protein
MADDMKEKENQNEKYSQSCLGNSKVNPEI